MSVIEYSLLKNALSGEFPEIEAAKQPCTSVCIWVAFDIETGPSWIYLTHPVKMWENPIVGSGIAVGRDENSNANCRRVMLRFYVFC